MSALQLCTQGAKRKHQTASDTPDGERGTKRPALLWPSGVLKRPPPFRCAIFEVSDLFRLVRGYLDPGVFVCKTAMLFDNGQDRRMRALRTSLRKARADLKHTHHFFDHVAAAVYFGWTGNQQCTERQSVRLSYRALEQYGYTHRIGADGMLIVNGPGP